MQRWYRYILQVMLGLCSCMPIAAMNIPHIPVLTDQLRSELWHALEQNNIQHIKYLLNTGIISVHSRSYDGDTPLNWAAQYGNVEVIALLLDRGAHIESKDNIGGETPLHYAARNGKVEAIALLLDRGANIESKIFKGWTPLHYAAYGNKVKIMALLLDRGANIESKTNGGKTLISIALNKLNSENITEKREGQEILDLIIRSKPYYINMSQRPSTLLGTVVMYMLKKSKEHNSQREYDYISTAQQIATQLPDERARELLNTLRTASTLEEQKQAAKRYLKQYIERQDANAASELATIPVRKEGLREITGQTHGLKDIIHLRK